MRVNIVQTERRSTTPQWIKAEAEIVFDQNEPMLQGIKLVGIVIGQSHDGQKLFVKWPGRSFTVQKDGKQETKTFEYLRCAVDRDFTGLDALRHAVLEAYLQEGAEQQSEPPDMTEEADPFA